MRITIVGAGPVGLATALQLAKLGHKLTILDKNPVLIANLWRGKLASSVIGLDGFFDHDMDFGIDPAMGLKAADLAIIAVDTPEKRGLPQSLHIRTAAQEIAENSPRGQMVLVRSSLTVGLSTDLEMAHGLAIIPHPINEPNLLFGTQNRQHMALLRQMLGPEAERACFSSRQEAELLSFANFRKLGLGEISFFQAFTQAC